MFHFGFVRKGLKFNLETILSPGHNIRYTVLKPHRQGASFWTMATFKGLKIKDLHIGKGSECNFLHNRKLTLDITLKLCAKKNLKIASYQEIFASKFSSFLMASSEFR